MNPKKVYTIDPAFAHRLGSHFSENKGRILENIVYLELLRRGKEVFYHTGKLECDFLVKEGLDIVEAIQVVYQLDATNCEREYVGLHEAMQTYNITRGLLITNDIDEEFNSKIEGLEIIPIWKWLLS
jgi:predicted AAA+ superfamily ATPase